MGATEVSHTVNSQRIRLSRDRVLAALVGVEPGPIRKHAVDVDGRIFPVKEAYALATGLDVLDFNTNQARKALRALGFPVQRVA